jgi:hypothetical protein
MEYWNSGMMEYWLFNRILSITIFIVKTNRAINSFPQSPLQARNIHLWGIASDGTESNRKPTPIIPVFQHSNWGEVLTCSQFSVILVRVGLSNTTGKPGNVIFHKEFLKIQ